MKEEKIKEVLTIYLLTPIYLLSQIAYELDVAKRACEELIRQHQKTLSDCETHWQSENEKLERHLESTLQKLKRIESDRDRNLSERREHDILKAKYATLEDKIKRQEAYMKSRLLKDKTNTLHVPDALLKSSSSSSSFPSSNTHNHNNTSSRDSNSSQSSRIGRVSLGGVQSSTCSAPSYVVSMPRPYNYHL